MIRRITTWLRKPVVSMALFALAVYALGVGKGDLRNDSAVYGWIAKHMVVSGDYLNLYFDWGQKSYFNKPPLLFWLAAASFRVFGFEPLAARAVSVAFALGCVAVTYLLARKRFTPTVSATAGMVLAASFPFMRWAVGFRPDAGVAFFFLLCLLAGAGMLGSMRTRWRDWLLMGAAIGLGFMLKGPVVFTGPMIVAVTSAWLRRRDILFNPRWLAALLLALAIALPWHIQQYLRWGDEFIAAYFGREIASRFDGSSFKAEPIWGYAHELLLLYWPWLPFTLIGAWAMLKTRRARAAGPAWHAPPRDTTTALFTAWLLVYGLAIHLVTRKYDRYLLPWMPALAILAAIGLYRSPLRGVWRRWLLPNMGWVSVIAAVVLLAAGLRTGMVYMPEITDAAPVINAAVREAGPARTPPVVYLYENTHDDKDTRCTIMFSTEARCVPLKGGVGFTAVPPGQFVVVPVQWREKAERELPAHEVVTRGKRYVIYRVTG
ncbi:MAG: glycosyltransferase family 39 protein [Planctomycetes bacterium]|nr:glycosyltransferase family 39 protein [Planctomycetota bacterium]